MEEPIPETGAQQGMRKRLRLRTLMVVIPVLVIGVIAILWIPVLSTLVVVRVSTLPAKARVTKIKADLMNIVHAAELYQAFRGSFPQSIEKLKRGGTGAQGTEDLGVSLGRTMDPWGNEYIYELTGDGKPRARCLGKDGVEGGEGENRDHVYTGGDQHQEW